MQNLSPGTFDQTTIKMIWPWTQMVISVQAHYPHWLRGWLHMITEVCWLWLISKLWCPLMIFFLLLADPVFIQTFLTTYKTFTTLNELFDLLVAHYNIQPPKGLNPKELSEWTKVKQSIVQSQWVKQIRMRTLYWCCIRVLNMFKTMITDEDVLGKDDKYILDCMKGFISQLDVSEVPAMKTLSIVIEWVVSTLKKLCEHL